MPCWAVPSSVVDPHAGVDAADAVDEHEPLGAGRRPSGRRGAHSAAGTSTSTSICALGTSAGSSSFDVP